MSEPVTPSAGVVDQRGRPLSDLRISVTDRCNFRCGYCMPREHFDAHFKFLPRSELLSYEEIARIARVFAGLGVTKLRLTGGEPLLRADLPKLVELLRAIDGVEIALTTNGSRLAYLASDLANAGLDRVTVSLDSLDDAVFKKMTDSNYSPSDVLAGIDAAVAAGLTPLKINAVVRRGINDHTLVDLSRHFKGTGHVVRFIEYMDVGVTNGWQKSEVVSGREIIERIGRELPLEPLSAAYRGEVAKRWRYADGSGEIGVITSVTEPFCGDCARARLSADGHLYTCLFAAGGADLNSPRRAGASDLALESQLRSIWQRRTDRYSEERASDRRHLPRIEMSYIGG